MHPLSKLLLAAALLLVAVGVGLAVLQPGDLGDSETETAQPAVTTTTEPDIGDPGEDVPSEAGPGDDTTTSTPTSSGDQPGTSAPSTTGAPATSTTTAAGGDVDAGPDAGGQATTTTTAGPGSGSGAGPGSGGSGLDGGSSAPRDLEDGLADTGGTTFLGAALALAAVATALPRRRA